MLNAFSLYRAKPAEEEMDMEEKPSTPEPTTPEHRTPESSLRLRSNFRCSIRGESFRSSMLQSPGSSGKRSHTHAKLYKHHSDNTMSSGLGQSGADSAMVRTFESLA